MAASGYAIGATPSIIRVEIEPGVTRTRVTMITAPLARLPFEMTLSNGFA